MDNKRTRERSSIFSDKHRKRDSALSNSPVLKYRDSISPDKGVTARGSIYSTMERRPYLEELTRKSKGENKLKNDVFIKMPSLHKRPTLQRLSPPVKETGDSYSLTNLIPKSIRKIANKMLTLLPGFKQEASPPSAKRRSEVNKKEILELNRRKSRKSLADFGFNKRGSKLKLSMSPESLSLNEPDEFSFINQEEKPVSAESENFLQPLELLSPGGDESSEVLLNEKMENYYNNKLEELSAVSYGSIRRPTKRITSRQNSTKIANNSRNNAIKMEQMERLRNLAQHLLKGDEKDIEELEDIQDDNNEIISSEKLHSVLIQKNKYEDSFFLEIEEKFSFRSILFDYKNYKDDLPFLDIRRRLLFIKRLISLISFKIVTNNFYHILTMILIITNNTTVAERHRNPKWKEGLYDDWEEFLDIFFLLEMIFKMAAFGILFKKYAYFQDPWNILDFFVLLLTIIGKYILVESNLNFAPFRTLRLLKILKIRDLEIVMDSVITSLKLLVETFFVLLFVTLFYAISGVHLFSGLLKQKCFDPLTGRIPADSPLCGNLDCPEGLICFKGLENPQFDSMHFDNIFISCLQVLKVFTLTDWTNVMYSVQRTFSNFTWIFFFSMVIIGNFLLLNLVLAVLKVKFSETQENLKRRSEKIFFPRYNFKLLQDKRIFISNRLRKKNSELNSVISVTTPENRTFNRLNTILLNEKNQEKILAASDAIPLMNLLRQYGNEASKAAIDVTDMDKNYFIPTMFLKKKPTNFVERVYFFVMRLLGWEEEEDEVVRIKKKYLEVVIKVDQVYKSLSVDDVVPSIKENFLNKQMMLQKKMLENLSLHFDFSHELVSKEEKKLLEKYIPQKQKMAKFQKKKLNTNKRLTINQIYESLKLQQTGDSNKSSSSNSSSSDSNDSESERSKRNSSVLLQSKKARYSRSIYSRSLMNQLELKKNSVLSQKTQSICEGVPNETQVQDPQNPLNAHKPLKSTAFGAQASGSPKKKKVAPGNKQIRFKENEFVLEYTFIKKLIDDPIYNEEKDIEEENFLDYTEAYVQIREQDLQKKRIERLNWSGKDVILPENYYPLRKLEIILEALSDADIDRYRNTLTYRVRFFFREIVLSLLFSNIVFLIVMLNTITLSLEGILDLDAINRILTFTTIFFIFEQTNKILAYGLENLFRSSLNIMDFTIVVYSVFDVFLKEQPAFSFYYEIKSLRLLRITMIFRILRYLFYIEYIKFLIMVVKKTFKLFIYLALIFVLLIIAFGLLAVQIYGADFDLSLSNNEEKNFTTMGTSFITIFNIITLDNWSTVLIQGFRRGQGYSTSLILIALIVIGNFIMLSLNIAIILDGFESASKDEERKKKEEDDEMTYNKFKQVQEMQIFKKLELEEELDSSDDEADVTDMNKFFLKPLKILEWLGFEENIKYFKHIDTKRSLYIFTKSNPFRRFCYRMTLSQNVEKIMIVAIFADTCVLGLNTYINWESQAESNSRLASYFFRSIINLVFGIECFIKIVALGFIERRNSYVRKWTHVLDFLCIIIFLFEASLRTKTILNASIIIHLWRPLQLILKKKSLKIIFEALIFSFKGLLNILIVIMVVWLIFGILGVEIFKNRFGYCSFPENFHVGIQNCPNNEWKNHSRNFDNIFNALLTLFDISTLDSWSKILHIAVNSNVASEGPIRFNNQFSSYTYFITFILIGVWILLNFFVGVLFSNFMFAEERVKHAYLNSNQVKWIEIQKLILNTEPYTSFPERRGLRKTVFNILQSEAYRRIMTYCIGINFLYMAFYFDDTFKSTSHILRMFTLILTIVYQVEMVFKIYAFSFKEYFKSRWFIFEALVAFSYLANIVIEYLLDDYISSNIESGKNFIRVFKVLKILGMIRLLRRVRAIRNIARTLMFSYPLMMDMTLVLTLVFFIYSIAGWILFRNVKKGKVIDDYVNFKNIMFSMMTLFKCSTREDWSEIMFDTADEGPDCLQNETCGSKYSPVYFISFMLVTSYTLMNMFVLILIQHFEEYHKGFYKILTDFQENKEKFRFAWLLFTRNSKKKTIHLNRIIGFLKFLGSPIGFDQNEEINKTAKKLVNMDLKRDQTGNIYFNEVLYSVFKSYFYDLLFLKSNYEALRTLFISERMFFYNLELKKIIQTGTRTAKDIRRNTILSQMKDSEMTNPLYNYFNAYVAFRSWKRFLVEKGKVVKNTIPKNKNDIAMVEEIEEPIPSTKNIEFVTTNKEPVTKHESVLSTLFLNVDKLNIDPKGSSTKIKRPSIFLHPNYASEINEYPKYPADALGSVSDPKQGSYLNLLKYEIS